MIITEKKIGPYIQIILIIFITSSDLHNLNVKRKKQELISLFGM